MERIDKLLSKELNITRNEVGNLLKSGAVSVNGKVIKSKNEKIDENNDSVFVSGKEIDFHKFVYIMMNKPKGVISSTDGKKTSEKTVIDILPAEMKRKNLFPAGRLDKDTTGFMLITDDGEFAHNILSPKKHIDKTYIATLDKPFDENVVKSFENGMESGKDTFMPAEITAINEEKTIAEVVLKQGLYHQIKRMFKKFGITVVELKRIKMGNLFLDENLKGGECRYLSGEEILKIIS